MADISWIKLKTTMFDDEKIRLIQSLPEADAILVVWVRLLVLAGKTNDDGLIYIQRNMPYTDEMLATLFSKPVNVIRLALNTLCSFEMIDLGEDGLIAITNWERHQNVNGMDKVRELNAKRNKAYRERKKQLKLESDVTVTSRDATDIDKELDLDIEQDKEKDKDKELKDIPLSTDLKVVKKDTKKVVKHQYGFYKNVLLSDDQLNKLKKEFVNDWEDRIEKVSEYCASSGKTYKDYLATIRAWARKDKENKKTKIETLPDWAKESNSKPQQPELTPMTEERKKKMQEMLKSIEEGNE